MKGTLPDRVRAVYRRDGLSGIADRVSWARLGHARSARADGPYRQGRTRHTFQSLSYLDIYERYFMPLRHQHIRVLEIDVLNGGSLRLWKRYFPHAQIFGLDLDPACRQHEASPASLGPLLSDDPLRSRPSPGRCRGGPFLGDLCILTKAGGVR